MGREYIVEGEEWREGDEKGMNDLRLRTVSKGKCVQ